MTDSSDIPATSSSQGHNQASAEDVIGYLRGQQLILVFDPASGTLHAGTGEAAQTITLKTS